MLSIWCSISTPDADTADRAWVLTNSKHFFGIRWCPTLIRYSAHNRLMRWIEAYLERRCYRRFDVSY